MSEFRDGIKLKTTTANAFLLKLLWKWYPNQSLPELRAKVQNHEYISLTDLEKSWMSNCPFVLFVGFVGSKKLVKRKAFEDYIGQRLII